MIEKAEAMVLLRRWEQVRYSLDVVLTNIEAVHGAPFDSPLWNALEDAFDAYTEALQQLLDGGEGDWLSWYMAENKMGKSGLQAGFDKKLKRIRNLDDLWKLIETGRER